jgi:outer membrane lipoprotein SlyB
MTHLAHRLAVLFALSALAACVSTQRAGQSTTVQFGVVRNADPVTLDSNAAAGALVGGKIGLARAQGRRGRSSAQNMIVGAGAGGALGSATDQNRRGVSYTVDMADGSTVRVVSDQREIRVGDCVAVERVRSTANIRRAPEQACDTQNARAVQAVQASARNEAAKCAAAKDELVRASTADEAELAERKIELLCGG